MSEKTVQVKSKRKSNGIGAASTLLVVRNLPYIFFLVFLGTIYIANAHYAEKKVRRIQVMQQELKEKRWKFMSLKSELMYQSTHNEIAEKVKPLGLKTLRTKPKKIIIPKK